MAVQANPENNFRTIVKNMSSFIKTYHHLTHVNCEPTTPTPASLKRTQNNLIFTVKPAYPNALSNQLKTGNAKNWTHTTLQILQEHYQRTLDDCTVNLAPTPRDDWEQAMLVATRWARRDLKRITNKTIEEAKEKIFKIQNSLIPPTQLTTNKTPQNTAQKTPTQQPQTPQHLESTPITKKRRTDEPRCALVFGSPGPLWSPQPLYTPERPATPDLQNVILSPIIPILPPPSNDNINSSPFESSPLYHSHDHQGNKYLNWTLSPTRQILIMGDSNISRLPLIKDPRIQVDCYPGANLSHAAHLIKNKTPTSDKVQKVILSFGLNNHKISNPTHLKKDLHAMLRAAKDTFPQASIIIPTINYSEDLPQYFQDNIKRLNHLIRDTTHQIPRLEKEKFSTGPDNIHWTKQTAQEMCKHWKSFLA